MVKFIDPTDEVQEHEIVHQLDLQKGIISLGYSRWRDGGPKGGWCTHLPVSPPDYQEKHHRTLAEIKVFEAVEEITFDIPDDYGTTYTLIITGEEMENPIVQREVKIIKAL